MFYEESDIHFWWNLCAKMMCFPSQKLITMSLWKISKLTPLLNLQDIFPLYRWQTNLIYLLVRILACANLFRAKEARVSFPNGLVRFQPNIATLNLPGYSCTAQLLKGWLHEQISVLCFQSTVSKRF